MMIHDQFVIIINLTLNYTCELFLYIKISSIFVCIYVYVLELNQAVSPLKECQ